MMQSTGGVTVKVFEKSLARELLLLTPRSSLISRNRRLRKGHLKASSLPDERTMKIAVIGLGYIGLPLAIKFAHSKQCDMLARGQDEGRSDEQWPKPHQAHSIGANP